MTILGHPLMAAALIFANFAFVLAQQVRAGKFNNWNLDWNFWFFLITLCLGFINAAFAVGPRRSKTIGLVAVLAGAIGFAVGWYVYVKCVPVPGALKGIF